MDKLGVGRREAGDAGTETGDAQVGRGTCPGAVSVLGATGWDGGAGADTGGRGQLDNQVMQMQKKF